MAKDSELLNNELQEDGQPSDYSEIIQNAVFLGATPFETIKESIRNQFSDYITREDTRDYVDAFYTQWKDSVDSITIEEEYPDDKLDVLYRMKDEFISFMEDLFETRLAITISVVDNAETDEDELELALRRLYEFFILNGRTYLKYAISTSIAKSIKYVIEDDSQFFNTVRDMLAQYSPFILALSPLEYIKTVGKMYEADDVQELFESGQITGNFLRKYSPKLYQNDDLECEIISDITMWNEWQKDEHTAEDDIQFESYLQSIQ